MSGTPLQDLNEAPEPYLSLLRDIYQRHAGQWGGPTADVHYMMHEGLQLGWRAAGGWDEGFCREELLRHDVLGQVVFLAVYRGCAWVLTTEGYKNIPVEELYRESGPAPHDGTGYQDWRAAKD